METAVNVPTTSFTGQSGFRNMPESVSPDSKMIDFIDLFLDKEIIQKMVDATNLRASQTKSSKPGDYYGNRWSDVTVAEMRVFIGVRLLMEHLVIKPRYSDYFATSRRLTAIPGFRSVFTRDRFLSIWKFWHLVDENDVNLNKANKLYKVRPFIDHTLKNFRHHYYPRQMLLSIDDDMIPAKNRLGFKQYCKDKPTKWGIKAFFLLTDSENGYLYNAEVYIGKSTDGSDPAELGATGNIVRRLLTGLEHQNHTVFLDRFYTSPTLFKYFIGEGFRACGTAMTNRKNFPKELIGSKKTLTRGQHKFLCSEKITAVVWFDKQPIYFLSSYHDPSITTMINRKNKDDTMVAVKCPQLVVDYNRFMGGVDHNDQMTKLYKPRKHYRWPRRLFLKCVMWACYNDYIVAGHYIHHRPAGSRPYTIHIY